MAAGILAWPDRSLGCGCCGSRKFYVTLAIALPLSALPPMDGHAQGRTAPRARKDALVEYLRLPVFRGLSVLLQNHLLYLQRPCVPAVATLSPNL